MNPDSFKGNQCTDKSGLPARNVNNKISCRRNNFGYRIPCEICLRDGESGGAVYIGETGENMHTRMKSPSTKFNSKKPHIRESSDLKTFRKQAWMATTRINH